MRSRCHARLALAKMRAALSELSIVGIDSNQSLHQALFDDDNFIKGGVSIHYLTDWLDNHSQNHA